MNSKVGFQPDKKWGLIWFTDGPQTNEGTGVGVYGYGTRIPEYVRGLRKYKEIYIPPGNIVDITALDDHCINSLVCDGNETAGKLATKNLAREIS
jgi:hypothetical protein